MSRISFEFSYTISNKWTRILSKLVSVLSKTYSGSQHRGNYVLKGATLKGKNMLLMGSIFFPLIVAPIRVENKFKGH